MPFLPAFTIAQAIKKIQKQELVLPGIQREFVWGQDQICALFDSLMRSYPIGSLLFWRVEPESIPTFSFYKFMLNYHQRDAPFCPKIDDMSADVAVTAVLDGQQRLTALNLGLRGSYARKLPYYAWAKDSAFPTTELYLNLLAEAPGDKRPELGLRYDFRMFPFDKVPARSDGAYWFRVPDILQPEFEDAPLLNDFLHEEDLAGSKLAFKLLFELRRVTHDVTLLQAYEEHDQSIDRVLDIFVRTNSAGDPLTRSDLVLSMATSQWLDLDAKEETRELLRHLNSKCGADFKFDKDFILKAGLALSGATEISIAARNFTTENMVAMEKEWDQIKVALRLTTKLLAGFGLSTHSLRATAVAIPVAIYLSNREVGDEYLVSPAFKKDRSVVKHWVLRSLLKRGTWSYSGTDTLLSALRKVILEKGHRGFPVEAVEAEMLERDRPLTFTDEEIEGLLDSKYGGQQTFALLAMLYPFIKATDHHHIDHIHPRASFHRSKLKTLGFEDPKIDKWQSRRNLLPNLQLLEGPENIAKQDSPPRSWADDAYPQDGGVENYLMIHDLEGLDDDVLTFDDFFETRRDRLKEKLDALVGSTVS